MVRYYLEPLWRRLWGMLGRPGAPEGFLEEANMSQDSGTKRTTHECKVTYS